MSKLTSALRAILPVKWVDNAEKVPAAVQSEIDKIVKDADAKVAALRKDHSIGSIQDKLATDLTALRQVYDRGVALLKADAAAQVKTASNVLPPVSVPSASVPAGPTGATGSGPQS